MYLGSGELVIDRRSSCPLKKNTGEDEATDLTLMQSEDGTQRVITRLKQDQAYQTLGVWIVADGNQ